MEDMKATVAVSPETTAAVNEVEQVAAQVLGDTAKTLADEVKDAAPAVEAGIIEKVEEVVEEVGQYVNREVNAGIEALGKALGMSYMPSTADVSNLEIVRYFPTDEQVGNQHGCATKGNHYPMLVTGFDKSAGTLNGIVFYDGAFEWLKSVPEAKTLDQAGAWVF